MDARNAAIDKAEEWLFRERAPEATTRAGRIRIVFMDLLRVLYLALYKSMLDRINFKAHGLTFISTLSVVPILAVSFSVAKGLGMADALREILFQQATGVQPEVLEKILGYVENTNARTLGVVGTVFLFYTVTKTLSNMEQAFNQIWEVAEERSLLRKFTDYLTIVMICPMLLLAAVTLTASLSTTTFVDFLLKTAYVGTVVRVTLSMVPFALSWVAISVLYQLMPNTRVPVLPALGGALIASVLWQVVQKSYIMFQIGVAKYNAIYGSFASLPLFLIWLYISWFILLLGAEIAQGLHGFGKIRPRNLRAWDEWSGEAMAMKLFLVMGKRFLDGEPAWTARQFALELGVPLHLVNGIMGKLAARGLVAKLTSYPPCFQPARDLDTLNLLDVLQAVREPEQAAPSGDAFGGRLNEILREVRCIPEENLANYSIRELVRKSGAE